MNYEDLDLQSYNVLGTPFRPHQEEYIRSLIKFYQQSNKKYMIFQGNVGIGKSLVALTTSKYISKNFKARVYLTSPKNILLDQYQNDYDSFLSVIKGGANYDCASISSCTYESAPCHISSKKRKCPLESICPYKVAVSQAQKDPIVLTNMHWLLCSMKNPKICPQRDLLIIDEAHSLESILTDFLSLSYSGLFLLRLEKIKTRVFKDSFFLYEKIRQFYYKSSSTTHSFLNQSLLINDVTSDVGEINLIIDSLEGNITSLKDAFEKALEKVDVTKLPESSIPGWVSVNKDYILLNNTLRKINRYRQLQSETPWLCMPTVYKTKEGKDVKGFTLKPLNAIALAKIILPQIARKIVFMSATMGEKRQFCKDLGVDVNDVEYIETQSDFPKEKRPIYLSYVGCFNKNTKEEYLKNSVTKIDELLEKYQGKKGVIHTTTFTQCDYIKEHSKYKNRILIHDTQNKPDVIKEFMESTDKVLCSPSSKEGLDLKDDLCRFQIILKVPWGDLTDKVVQARMKADAGWYANEAVKNLEQAYGRGMRSKTDWCDCYILDNSFQRLYYLNPHLFSTYFKEAIVSC